ncbi:putative pectinesterase 63 [Alnus glutinosa]|uniref:putative pectinesterase 63 n=1 Tax=Alnus glutinosa TaxID=3517 RepID=UPI002D78AE04|nr:putative pectinesterase 63 [Alnus glutinosa]
MARKTTCIAVHAALTTILLVATSVISDDATPIPADKSQVNSWFQNNVKSFAARKGTLDPALVKAEEAPKVITVSKTGSGNFKTISDAVNSIPAGNTRRVIVRIGGGQFNEKITVPRTKPFVTFYGSPSSMPTLTYSGNAARYGTVDSATLIVFSDYFTAANIIIVNSSPRPDPRQKGGQALALRIAGDKAALYNCKIKGFQDTVCDDKGNHFFKDCYVEGSVDFIFGSGKSLYLNTELHVLGDGGITVITAQGRQSASENTGFSFVHCRVTGTGDDTYLGRAWMSRPSVVFAYTTMSSVVNAAGWSDNFHPERDSTVYFGEYKNSGPGSSLSKRAKYGKRLGDIEAKKFLSLVYIKGSSWLLPPPSM